MPAGPPIGEREREILTAIVETFIATGEPVGSRTLARSNSRRAEPGHHSQCHGRLGGRRLSGAAPHFRRPRPSTEPIAITSSNLRARRSLSQADEDIIQDSLHGISDVQEFMERTSHVLSLISRNVGVAVAIGGPKNALEHVYFSRLGDQKVLAVVVTQSGLVRDRVLRLDLPQSDLDAAARFINENFRGWTMDAMRTSWRAGWNRNAVNMTG